MDQDDPVLATTDETSPVAPTNETAVEDTETAVDELLIEEISIDGMCGVY